MELVILALLFACVILVMWVLNLKLDLRFAKEDINSAIRERDEAQSWRDRWIGVSQQKEDTNRKCKLQLDEAKSKIESLEKQLDRHRRSWGHIKETLQSADSSESEVVDPWWNGLNEAQKIKVLHRSKSEVDREV